MKTFVKSALVAVLMLISLTGMAQKKTQNFTVTRTIPASAAEVWKVVGDDFGGIANSHPKIVNSEYVNGSLKSGEGAERVCNFNEKGTKYVQEKQINYDPENFTFTAQIYHADGLPLDPELNRAVYKVIPIDGNSSKLVLDMSLRTNPGFLGALLKGKFKKTMQDYALAVEHYTRTGEAVNKDNFKEIKKQYKG